MAIVKTARKLEIGDEIIPWANNEEEHNEFEKCISKAKEEIKSLPGGAKNITFLMGNKYRNAHSQNSKILYKRSVRGFYPASGSPDYKDHFLKFNWGMIRTSNYEEIAYLDMHPDLFVREANRELTPMEKLEKENRELKEKLEAKEKEKKDLPSWDLIETKTKFEKRNKKAVEKLRSKNGNKSRTNAGEEPAPAESDIE